MQASIQASDTERIGITGPRCAINAPALFQQADLIGPRERGEGRERALIGAQDGARREVCFADILTVEGVYLLCPQHQKFHCGLSFSPTAPYRFTTPRHDVSPFPRAVASANVTLV